MNKENWLLKIHNKNGVIVMDSKDAALLAVDRNGDRRSRPMAWLKQADFKAYLANGEICEHRGEYRVVTSVAKRLREGGCSGQHVETVIRDIYDPYGDKRSVMVNGKTCVLSRLGRLKNMDGTAFLSADEVEAANRFMHDYGARGWAIF